MITNFCNLSIIHIQLRIRGLIRFLQITIDSVFAGLKPTNQAVANECILTRFLFKIFPAIIGFSTIAYRLVSSANNLITIKFSNNIINVNQKLQRA